VSYLTLPTGSGIAAFTSPSSARGTSAAVAVAFARAGFRSSVSTPISIAWEAFRLANPAPRPGE